MKKMLIMGYLVDLLIWTIVYMHYMNKLKKKVRDRKLKEKFKNAIKAEWKIV